MSDGAGDIIPFGESGATMRAAIEGLTGPGVALQTGVAVAVASYLVDDYGARVPVSLVLVKDDGTRMTRALSLRHDAPPDNSQDATAAIVTSLGGDGQDADFEIGAWLHADVDGAGTAQAMRLLVTAAANGPMWTAYVIPDFLEAP